MLWDDEPSDDDSGGLLDIIGLNAERRSPAWDYLVDPTLKAAGGAAGTALLAYLARCAVRAYRNQRAMQEAQRLALQASHELSPETLAGLNYGRYLEDPRNPQRISALLDEPRDVYAEHYRRPSMAALEDLL